MFCEVFYSISYQYNDLDYSFLDESFSEQAKKWKRIWETKATKGVEQVMKETPRVKVNLEFVLAIVKDSAMVIMTH